MALIWSLQWAWTCFELSVSSCFLAPLFYGQSHQSLLVKQKCQYKVHSSPGLAVEDRHESGEL